MIVIIKRDDLLQEYRDLAIDNLELGHSGLPSELIEQAESVVFVEGSGVKFLKHFPGLHSKASLDVLTRYITSKGPTTIDDVRFSKKRVRHQKKTG